MKLQTKVGKSYTCDLQKDIYKDFPARFKELEPENVKKYVQFYARTVHPGQTFNHLLETDSASSQSKALVITSELMENKNALRSLIKKDPVLECLYEPGAFVLENTDGQLIPLESQILKEVSVAQVWGGKDTLRVHFKKSLWDAGSDDPYKNSLVIQILRDTAVVYGDEGRLKQEHISTHQLFLSALSPSTQLVDGWMFDLSALLALASPHFSLGQLGNIFVSTSALREAHYQKQKNNAFYHIQAINLPFHNVEFYYMPSHSVLREKYESI